MSSTSKQFDRSRRKLAGAIGATSIVLAASIAWSGCGPAHEGQPIETTPVDEATDALSTTLTATADTFVRDGSSATMNFGTSTTLEVKKSTSGFNREAYVRFDLSSFSGTVQNAKFRVFGQLSQAGTVPIVARLLGEDVFAFSETGTSWNTAGRQTMPIELARVSVNSTTGAWYEFDVTSMVRQRKRAGNSSVAFALVNPVSSTPLVTFSSREGANKPQLVINTATALFVVGSTTLGAGDAAVSSHLSQLGFSVTTKAAASTTSADATGQSLVVISSTIASADANTKFRDVTVPVVVWENGIYDDMKMTGTVSGTDYGTTASQTAVNVGSITHALAAGRKGSTTVSASNAATWGKPSSGAVTIATLAGDATKATVFGYDKGATMVGMTAPARRVGLFLGDTTPTSLTRSGWALFDAAVNWASGSKGFTVKKILFINYDPFLETFGQTVTQHYPNWPGSAAVSQQWLTDISLMTGDYVRYQIVQTITRDEWPLAQDGTRYDDANFVADYATPTCKKDSDCRSNRCVGSDQTAMPPVDGNCSQNLRNRPVDYTAIINQFGVDAAIKAGTYDEVFVGAPTGNGFAEEQMVGPNAYWVNSDPIVRTGVPNYFFEYIDSSVNRSSFEHAFFHRLENIMRHVYEKGTTYGQDAIFTLGPSNWNTTPYDLYCAWQIPSPANDPPTPNCATPRRHFWDNFTLVDGIAQNLRSRGDTSAVAGVGAMHYAPHAQRHDLDGYNWGEPWVNRLLPAVQSSCDDWMYNFPNFKGEKRLVDMSEFWFGPDDNKYEWGYDMWLFNHVPRVPGRHTDGVLYNWWEYAVNYNDYPEAL